jgi:hypothetical protein
MVSFLLALLENLALQLVFFVGIISVLGLLIWRLNKTFFRLLGFKKGKRVFLATGIIGVPIHEFGHVFFCILFLHKIKEVKWFTPNSTDGTLGYVRHTYKRRNPYHQIGNFFIGIGPLLFGSGVIVGLMFIFMYVLMGNTAVATLLGGGTSIGSYFSSVWDVFATIFHPANLVSVWWWIFIILACSIAMHMDLSWADIKGGLRGLLFITIILIIMNIILVLVGRSVARAVTNAFLWLSISVVSFMGIAVLILAVLVLITFIVVTIKRRVKRRIQRGKRPQQKPIQKPIQKPKETPAESPDTAVADA